MDDRVVGDARAERVVLLRLLGVRPARLLLLVVAAPGLGARGAGGGGADLDGVARDAAAARALGEALELVGGLVDGLEVALVLELLAGWGQVRMPHLGLLAAGQLDVALLEGRLELQEEQRLFDVEDLRHVLRGYRPTT
ncbi:MAG: UDP-N-acetylmuramate dehydrogenase [Conexibacter sp.]|nr:UDP-N-acetylmuramate dehydrogenase [Conexibacter sp.]